MWSEVMLKLKNRTHVVIINQNSPLNHITLEYKVKKMYNGHNELNDNFTGVPQMTAKELGNI